MLRALALSGLATALCAGQSMASNVDAYISGGNLFIYGDNGANELRVYSPADGEITVVGLPSEDGDVTTVNGNEVQTFSGWNRGIFAYLERGSDGIHLTSLDADGPIHLDLGVGHDRAVVGSLPTMDDTDVGGALPVDLPLELEDGDDTSSAMPTSSLVTTTSSLVVLGFAGSDSVELNDFESDQHVTIDTGNGADDISLNSHVHVGTNCVIVPGAGFDDVEINIVSVFGNLIVDDSTHALRALIDTVVVSGNAYFYATPEDDEIGLTELHVAGELGVFTENGDDQVAINGTSDRLIYNAAGGMDDLHLAQIGTNLATLIMGDGDDFARSDRSNIGTLRVYGANGSDVLHLQNLTANLVEYFGDGGNDLLRNSERNNIGTLRLYSVERQRDIP